MDTWHALQTRASGSYVSYTDSSGKEEEKILGQCKVITYDNTANELVVVPLNQATAPGASELQQKLNEVYKVSLASWDVTVEEALEIDQERWDVKEEDGELDYEAAGRKYSKEMRKIYKYYQDKRNIEDNKYYLFLTDFPVKNTLNSYMPFKGQFAFISAGEVSASQLPRVAAHELGHGTFRLYHTFSDKNDYIVPQGTTDNLMDYNNGKELHKYQWDYIHDPRSVYFSSLIDEEEAAMTWEFIDRKHTLLLNHIYDNNKIGNLEYAQKIEENSGQESINLDYSDEESDNWTDEQKQWIDQWDVGTYDGDDISESIIEKIQDAGDGETIESITLEKNRVYVGKYTVDETEYPVAVYSKKNTLDNLTKVQVTDLDNLDTDENKKHFYCDEGIIKYFIVAFYEDEEETPSLIMQVEKFNVSNWENTKKKWLEFLGILKKENENLFEMYCSDSIIEQNEYITISDNPEMPDLEVKNTSETQIPFRLKIEYRKDIREDETYFPDGEWETVEKKKIWDIDFGDKIRGGKATLQYKINGKTEEYLFHIRGKNPSEQEIKQYITEQGYDDIWFLTRLIRQESSFLHFYSGTDYGPNKEDYQGCPNHGSPHGWGLMQLDVIGGTRANPLRPTKQELWDWKANIDRGVQFIEGEKYNAVNRHFNNELGIIEEWNWFIKTMK